MLAKQMSVRPTNKALTMLVGTPAVATIVHPAVVEVWPQVAPSVLAGEQFTTLVATALGGLVSIGLAWFIPDRANIPNG